MKFDTFSITIIRALLNLELLPFALPASVCIIPGIVAKNASTPHKHPPVHKNIIFTPHHPFLYF